ncbi:neurotrimin-like isoform X3 [Acropora palmata]|uniref:neurotrimin-like isoform X3 n=1 Tax=Acropora palmata TaxID=6131 RepID=UPI003D9FB3BB
MVNRCQTLYGPDYLITGLSACMTLTDIRRQDAGVYRCIVHNGIGWPAVRGVFIVVQYPVEAIAFGENATVPQGGNKRFSCPVDGNPKPNISWYRGSEVSETPIFSGEKLEARESGCYTCVASNSVGKPVSITQCLEKSLLEH